MAAFWVCPFRKHLKPDFGGQEVMLCARREKQYFVGEFIFPVQAFFAFSGHAVQE